MSVQLWTDVEQIGSAHMYELVVDGQPRHMHGEWRISVCLERLEDQRSRLEGLGMCRWRS